MTSKSRNRPARRHAEATAPRATCPKTGRQLDEFGLPLTGPARAAELARLGQPDPREDPAAWDAGFVVAHATEAPGAPASEGDA
jgi:hypothetical protein